MQYTLLSPYLFLSSAPLPSSTMRLTVTSKLPCLSSKHGYRVLIRISHLFLHIWTAPRLKASTLSRNIETKTGNIVQESSWSQWNSESISQGVSLFIASCRFPIEPWCPSFLSGEGNNRVVCPWCTKVQIYLVPCDLQTW
jgi:hypothetical protein